MMLRRQIARIWHKFTPLRPIQIRRHCKPNLLKRLKVLRNRLKIISQCKRNCSTQLRRSCDRETSQSRSII